MLGLHTTIAHKQKVHKCNDCELRTLDECIFTEHKSTKHLECDQAKLDLSLAQLSSLSFILLIESLDSFLNTSSGIALPSLPWFPWHWSLHCCFQTLYWDYHSFFTMVSSTMFIVIREVLILNLKAYWFINDFLCAFGCL